jgi:hypothetical protein
VNENTGARGIWWLKKNSNATSSPWFFVSVASKGVSFSVSLLFATVAGYFVSVAGKGLMAAGCWREGNAIGWENLGEI